MGRTKPRRIGAVLRLGAMIVVPLTSGLFRRRWYNADGIPATGPAIVVVNHVSYIDPFVVSRFIWDCGRVPRFLAKRGLFELPVLGPLLRAAGQIPVSRGTRDAAQSLDAAVEALEQGEVVVVYPEGTVTRDADWWPMTAKTGAARLALLRPDVPVIAVGQWGAQFSVDVYRHRYRPVPRKTVSVAVGGPVDLSRFAGAAPTTATLRAVTETIMSAICAQVALIRADSKPVSADGA